MQPIYIKNKTIFGFDKDAFKKYFLNTWWLFLEKVCRMLFGLFIGVWLARYLGPVRLGIFSYAQSFVGIFSAFSNLGLDTIVIRELVKDRNKKDIILGTGFILKLNGTILVFLLISLTLNFIQNDQYTNLLIFIIAGGLFFQTLTIVEAYFYAQVLSKFLVWSRLFALLISSCIKIILLLLKASLMAFAFVSILDMALSGLGLIYFYKKLNNQLSRWRFNFSLAIELLINSFPILLASFGYLLYTYMDRILLEKFVNSREVGYYSVAIFIVRSFFWIPLIISNSLFPSIIQYKKKSKNLYHKRILSFYRLQLYISILFVLFILFFGDSIVTILYGQSYFQSIPILKIYAFVAIIEALGQATGRWYLVENLQLQRSINYLIGGILNIFLDVLLIPKYGSIGAAIATFISYFVAIVLMDFALPRTRNNFYFIIKSLSPL